MRFSAWLIVETASASTRARNSSARIRLAPHRGRCTHSAQIIASSSGSIAREIHGDIDIVLTPDGTDGYEEIARTATRERLEGTELEVPVASAEMILKSKTAADRPEDHAILDRMREVLNPLHPHDSLDPPDRSRGGHEPPDR